MSYVLVVNCKQLHIHSARQSVVASLEHRENRLGRRRPENRLWSVSARVCGQGDEGAAGALDHVAPNGVFLPPAGQNPR